jgi:hypothetical protein
MTESPFRLCEFPVTNSSLGRTKRRMAGEALTRTPPITLVAFGKETAASRSILRKSLNAGSIGIAVPDEHLLLRDARGAVRRQHYRRSVLDAATATELALTAALRAKYSGTSQVRLLDGALEGIRMLGPRTELCRRAVHSSSEDTRKDYLN